MRIAKSSRNVAAALSISLLGPALALAQAAPGSIEAGVGAGRLFGGSFPQGSTNFQEELRADDDILRGFWVGAQITREWSVEVAVRGTKTRFVFAGKGVFPEEPEVVGFDFATIEAVGLYSFRLGNLLPYVGIGLGVANLDPDAPNPAIRDSNRFALSVAGGARFYAARWLGLRADVRGRAASLEGGHWFRNVEVLGGVFFSFGGR